MKSLTVSALGLFAVALPALSLAASITLTNGGLGQIAADTTNFGVAICNGSKTALSASVPVSVTANGVSETTNSAGSIAAGVCEYTYLPYSQFNMQAGGTYSVAVAIDPNHTVITNTNNQTSYSVTVPTAQASAGAQGSAGTADVSAQSGNVFIAVWDFLFGWIK
ncbi:MAG TPA: hypothetical protein VHZ04_01385 [Candidatus Paceibacterota bacterium]|nr:hypothetical protein [Candidatus Paceibacterota bacterium]